jgi:hypothetical protein
VKYVATIKVCGKASSLVSILAPTLERPKPEALAKPSQTGWFEDARATVATFASVAAAVLALVYYLLRFGFTDNSPVPILETLCLSWFLINFPSGCRWVLRLGKLRTDSWATSDGALALVGLALLIGASAIVPVVGFSTAYLFETLGLVLFLAHAWRWLATGRVLASLVFLAVAGFFALFLAGRVWGSTYQNPLFVPSLLEGQGCLDTLCHVSRCNMLRTYGVNSTGLDGIPVAPYHYASHWAFAQLCNLLDMPVLTFYNLGFPVIFIPFYLSSLLFFAINLAWARDGERRASGPPLRGAVLFWFLFLVAHVGFLGIMAGDETATNWKSIFVSESYSLGVAISLLGIVAAANFFRAAREEPGLLSGPGGITTVLLLAVLLGLIGLTKISIMVLLFGAAVYACVRLGQWQRWQFYVFLVAALACAYLSFRSALRPSTGQEMKLIPLGFIREYIPPGWWALFPLLYLLWLWLFLFCRLNGAGISTLDDLARALRRRELVDAELLVIVTAAALAPGLLGWGGSGAFYFSDYPKWLAVGLLLGLVALPRRIPAAAPTSFRSRLGMVRVSQLFYGLVALSLAGVVGMNTLKSVKDMVAFNILSRGGGLVLKQALKAELRDGNIRAVLDRLSRQAEVAEARLENRKIIQVLLALDRLPPEEKKQTALYIPKTNRAYWDLFDPRKEVWRGQAAMKSPFVAPALSGLAMIHGLPEARPSHPGWAYEVYDLHNLPRADLSQKEVCRKASSMGFAKVIILEAKGSGDVRQITLACR